MDYNLFAGVGIPGLDHSYRYQNRESTIKNQKFLCDGIKSELYTEVLRGLKSTFLRIEKISLITQPVGQKSEKLSDDFKNIYHLIAADAQVKPEPKAANINKSLSLTLMLKN